MSSEAAETHEEKVASAIKRLNSLTGDNVLKVYPSQPLLPYQDYEYGCGPYERAWVEMNKDVRLIANEYMKLVNRPTLDAANEGGFWWHVDEEETLNCWYVFVSSKTNEFVYANHLQETVPAKGGRWQKAIYPFNILKSMTVTLLVPATIGPSSSVNSTNSPDIPNNADSLTNNS